MVVAEDDEVVVVVEVNIFEAEGNEAVASFIKPQIPLVTYPRVPESHNLQSSLRYEMFRYEKKM